MHTCVHVATKHCKILFGACTVYAVVYMYTLKRTAKSIAEWQTQLALFCLCVIRPFVTVKGWVLVTKSGN